jgi:hypothetical protein
MHAHKWVSTSEAPNYSLSYLSNEQKKKTQEI